MKIVLAQIRKDIRCQSGLLVAWAICAALSIVPAAFIGLLSFLRFFPHGDPGVVMLGVLSIGGFALAGAFSVGVGMLLLVPLLVIRIVHEDALLGTTAFWRTRPLPREKLLAAKALLISGLLVPLVLIASALNASVGAGHFWTVELAWVSAFAAFASITSGAKDFMIYPVSFLVGKSVFSSLFEQLWGHFRGGNTPLFHEGMSRPFILARAVHLHAPDFYHLCYFAGFTAVFIHQYLTLKTKQSLALLIGVVVAVSLLQILGGTPGGAYAGH